MADLQWTHRVEIRDDRVVKRYIGEDTELAGREWRALTLLAEHAPGLAPQPIALEPPVPAPPGAAGTGASSGAVTMSRLPGVALRSLPDAGAYAAHLARAVGELHAAVPRDVLAGVPERPWHLGPLVAQVKEWCARWKPREPLADQAVREGARWLAGWRPGDEGVTPVFGAGDGNLANFLWDGVRVRIVDFEESGRSDRAFELSEISQHVAMWVDGEVDVLAHVELSPAEGRRLTGCRRLHALMWLFLLSSEGPRNPPGTFRRQAGRVLRSLGA
ncbi:aminoglycoside phosphotransferase family protein [Nonomuraea sp. SMC257]|uniref:Aminoglycoside phosphotransferase family protein n=1 Tax=Nonomuraea montanisoli TaxID=2741721 RepID=A0A7Y6I2D3_9ACTN|nr:aminoglycoside phosphotransferase family protein [Nonomuraea montanisoli]NUW30417.1 aminoglycoside phosphotransferase family protein [Nonomuraea montanisoli]